MATKMKSRGTEHEKRADADADTMQLDRCKLEIASTNMSATLPAASAECAYQHVTAIRCPRCKSVMRANGTRLVTDGNGGTKQLKRWLCPSAVCRRTHETVGVPI